MATPYYKVELTVLEALDTYGNQVDITQDVEITDYINDNGISSIKTDTDDGDFDVGLFTVGDLTLKCINHSGKFSDYNDWRSLFPYSRDKAKVDIIYVDSTGTENTRFKGLTAEEAAKDRPMQDSVTLKILSQESILRKVNVPGGLINSGITISEAIQRILNRPIITNIVSYNAANINPKNDITIDGVEGLDGESSRDALNRLLVASNSVLLVNSSNEFVVKARTENANTVFNFYGPNDYFGRQNIINLRERNNGLHRAFNSVTVNDFTFIDQKYIDQYGLRKKDISLDFITDEEKARAIAQSYVEEFRVPRDEMMITVRTEDVKDLVLFDRVSVDYEKRIEKRDSAVIPLYGNAEYGSATYPLEVGSFSLSGKKAFKIISIRENPRDFTTDLKLRQLGTTEGDGWYS